MVESPSSPFVPSFSYKSADGSEIHERHQSRLVVYPCLPLLHYVQGFLYIPGGNGLISEPSTVGEGHLSAYLVPNAILFGSPSCPIHPPMYHPPRFAVEMQETVASDLRKQLFEVLGG